MFIFFASIYFVSFVAFVFLLIKFIKAKKSGLNISDTKKKFCIVSVVFLISMILVIITSPDYDQKNSVNTKDNNFTEESDGSNDKEGIKKIKKELKEKYDISEPSSFVQGDVTGKWRVLVVANSTPPSEYAVDYARAYIENTDTTIHYIINFSLKTTSQIQISFGIVSVKTTEYVDKEEHNAKIIGEGMLLGEDYYKLETGEKITVEADPNAGTVDGETLITAVKDTISGAIGKNEKIVDVTFDGKDLCIIVDVSNSDTSQLTAKEIAESRISSITQKILDLGDKYQNTSETITLDFGSEGKVTFNKKDIKNQGLGKYFDVPAGVLD